MKIIGQCLQCGQCCLFGEAFTYDVFKKGEKFIYVFKKVNKKRKYKISPCPKLIYDIYKRKAMCSDFENRPEVCKQFPYKKEELIFKGCGYHLQ